MGFSMKTLCITIAVITCEWSHGLAQIDTISVALESAREDSVEHLFKPALMRGLGGPQLIAGLPEIESVKALPIKSVRHAQLSFLDATAGPIIIWGVDDEGQDMVFSLADSGATPTRLEIVKRHYERTRGEALYTELIVPAIGKQPDLQLELFISKKHNGVLHRNLHLRMGEAVIGGKSYALAYVRDPRFASYSLPGAEHSFSLFQLMIDLDGNGEFITNAAGLADGVGQIEAFEVTKPFSIDGEIYKVVEISPSGNRLVIGPSEQKTALAVDFEMPPFSATDLDGNLIESAALRGKMVVLNWWQTTCAPCIAEMPELNQLVAKYNDVNIRFLAIANDEETGLRQFLKKRTFDYDIAVANKDAIQLFGEAYPRHVIVDASGKIVYDVLGFGPGYIDRLDATIASLMTK